MKLNKISSRHKRFIIIATSAIVIITVLLVLFLRRPDSAPGVTEYSVPEHAIDSVLAQMSDNEKAGMLIFANAEINDSTDFKDVMMLSHIYSLSSWLISSISFDYHKPVSDSLLAIPSAPGTYAVKWDAHTPDGGQLPGLNTLLAMSDTSFATHFAKNCANLFYSNGINCIVIPPAFDKNTLHLPDVEHINKLILLIDRIFNPDIFCPSMVIFHQSEINVIHNDSTFKFPDDDLLSLFNQNKNYSFLTENEHQPQTQGLLVTEYEKGTDIKKFILSSQDMLLVETDDIEFVYDEIAGLINNSNYKEKIYDKLKRIISAKLFAGFFRENHQTDTVNPGTTAWETLLLNVAEHTSCLFSNNSVFPLLNAKAHFIVAAEFQIPVFHKLMKKTFSDYAFSMIETDNQSIKIAIEKIKNSDTPIVFIQGDEPFQMQFSNNDTLFENRKLALVDFSGGRDSSSYHFFDAILIMGEPFSWYQQAAANLIIGGSNVYGQFFKHHKEYQTVQSESTDIIRLKYSYPEDAGLDGEFLTNTIDSICMEGINRGAFPGCQVFAAKNGKIVFNKAYGHLNYSKTKSVQTTDLYDVASVTKIAATTIAAMKMCDQGKLSLNETIMKYFKNTEINYTRIKPDTVVIIDTLNLNKVDLRKLITQGKLPKDTFRIKDTLMVTIDSVFSKATPSLNIFKVPVRYMLMHYSGIVPTLPILPFIQLRKYHLIDLGLDSDDPEAQNINWKEVWNIRFSDKRTDSSRVQIADNFWMKDRWLDSLWARTKEVGVSGRKYSQYTDLNMILVQLTIDSINKINMDRYMQREFYGPLGLKNTMYKPLDHKVPRSRIAPTENDRGWRRQVVHGHVHDPSAAMLGGISGNAGLFSSAEDLGILFQMLLNWGTYGGRRYLSESIIRTFIKTHEETGRGLGFDKYSPKNIVAPSASKNTYGHTGFTGCCVWVDPDYQLVYVFLSNRVHPNVNNWRLNGMKIRQNVHQAFYDADLNKRDKESQRNKEKIIN